jgi:hypothetical protein
VRLPLISYPLHLAAGDLATAAVVELGGARIGVPAMYWAISIAPLLGVSW